MLIQFHISIFLLKMCEAAIQPFHQGSTTGLDFRHRCISNGFVGLNTAKVLSGVKDVEMALVD